jgi:sec-independent protein translocase protein TatC
MSVEEARMSLVEHLTELRDRLVRSALAIIVAFFVAYGWHVEVFDLLATPVRSALAERGIYRLLAIEVTETIFVYLKASLLVGIVGASPVIFHQIWAFVAPGLLPSERRFILPIGLFSTLFFLVGVSFAYVVLIPFMTGFLADLALAGDQVELKVTMSNAFSFTFLALLTFGAVFELPIAMFFLTLFGIANHTHFIRYFRYFIVVAFIVGAVLTPPDPISQVMLAVPMVGLYGIGILVAWLIGSPEYDDDGVRKPIGLRVWAIVSAALLGIAGSIALLVVALTPGPGPTELIPRGTAWAVGGQPDQIGREKAAESLASLLAGEPFGDGLRALAMDEDTEKVVVVQDEEGRRAVIADSSEGAWSAIDALLPQETDIAGFEARRADAAGGLARVSLGRGIAAFGDATLASAIARCHEDEAECLDPNGGHTVALAALETSGPAWLYVPVSDSAWYALLPLGDALIGHARHLGAVVVPEEDPELLWRAELEDEAAATAFRARLSAWKDQRSEQREATLGVDAPASTLELTALVGELAHATDSLLAATEPAALPEGPRGAALAAAREDARARLDRARKTLDGLLVRERNRAALDEVHRGGTLLDRVPGEDLLGWTVKSAGAVVEVRFRLRQMGLDRLLVRAQAP